MANKLTPLIRPFLDGNGDPYSGAKLFVYTAGSTTKVTVYQDEAGGVSHANPIILNSRGEIANGSGATKLIWQPEGTTLDFVLAPSTDTDPPVSAIDTYEDVIGINDTTTTVDQWVLGATPTFINTTSFSLVGDQTTNYHVGRRVKTTNSGGTIYSTIIASAYTTLTTVTVVNDSGVLDSGISASSYGLLSATNNSVPDSPYLDNLEGADVASATTANIWSGYGRNKHITGTTTITSLGEAKTAGDHRWIIFDDALTLTHSANLNLPGDVNITTSAGDCARVYADTTTQLDVQYFYAVGYNPLTIAADQGSSMVLISSATASSSATIDFTGLDSTYDEYVFKLTNVVAATDTVTLGMQYGDSGSYRTTQHRYHVTDLSDSLATYSALASASAASILINSNLGNASDESYSGEIHLTATGSTTLKTFVSFQGTSANPLGEAVSNNGSGSYSGTLFAVDRVRFLLSSGNIASGEFRLYGIKKA